MKKSTLLLTIPLLVLQLGESSLAQSLDRRIEIGVQFALVRQADNRLFDDPAAPTRWNPGLGGRVAYNFAPHLALEGELDFFPKDDLFNGKKVAGQFGLKAGYRSRVLGLFAKARPGFIHSTKSVITCLVRSTVGSAGIIDREFVGCPSVGSRTEFALDIGGVFELYPSRGRLFRFDIGDTLQRTVEYPIEFNNGVGMFGRRPRTVHNLQLNVGVGFRF